MKFTTLEKELIATERDLYNVGVELSKENITSEFINREAAKILGIPEDATEREKILVEDSEIFERYLKVWQVVNEYRDFYETLVDIALPQLKLFGGLSYENPKFLEDNNGESFKRLLIGIGIAAFIGGLVLGVLYSLNNKSTYQQGYNTITETQTTTSIQNKTIITTTQTPIDFEKERIDQLKGIGLSDELAKKFDKEFQKYAINNKYNQTHLEFAKFFSENPDLASYIFSLFKDFNKSNNVLHDIIDKPNSLEFVKQYPDLIKSKKYQNALELYSRNSTLAKILFDNILRDNRTNCNNKNDLIDFASKLFLDLNYASGKVKVLDSQANTFREEFLKLPTIQAFGNYSAAITCGVKQTIPIFQPGHPYDIKTWYLPLHDRTILWLFGNATQINPDIVYFKPIILKDYYGNVYVIQSKDIPRDVWMLIEHIKRTPEVVKYPEMYLAFSIKVQQNADDIFNNPEHQHYQGVFKTYIPSGPTDEKIWNEVIIPQWKYYWESTPQAGNVSKRITIFPWYNSTLLRELISNETDIIIALIKLWELQPKICDLDKNCIFDEDAYHYGFDAMKYQIETMLRLYNEISKEYPNGYYIRRYTKEPDKYTNIFYDYFGDRAYWGHRETFKQFLGVDEHEIDWNQFNRTTIYRDLEPVFSKYDSINTYLNKTLPYYQLIKLIFGYVIKYGGVESAGLNHYYPSAFRAFGIPYGLTIYSEHYANIPARYAANDDAGIFGLPDYVVKPLKEGKYGEFLVLPGNGISFLGSNLEGLKKDLEIGKKNPVEPNAKYAEVYVVIRGNKIILFADGNPG
ncbi:MAG: hypothetical protein QW409_01115 [Candidatus Aenigmatarchaeota archaeon]